MALASPYGYTTSGPSANVYLPITPHQPADTRKNVKDAERALKKAHDAHRKHKAAQRAQAKIAAKRKRAHEAGLAALHDIAKTGHRDASDARVEAARLLLEYGKGNY